jgi:hypothetical protein
LPTIASMALFLCHALTRATALRGEHHPTLETVLGLRVQPRASCRPQGSQRHPQIPQSVEA